METTTPTWPTLRAWLELPAPGVPGLTRAQVYCLGRVLTATKSSSPVRRYLTRKLHRGKDAAEPTKAQLNKLLPVFQAKGFGQPENEDSQHVTALATEPNQNTQ